MDVLRGTRAVLAAAVEAIRISGELTRPGELPAIMPSRRAAEPPSRRAGHDRLRMVAPASPSGIAA